MLLVFIIIAFTGYFPAVISMDVTAMHSTVGSGRLVMLSCCATGALNENSPPEYSWLRTDEPLPTSVVGNESFTMFLPNITDEDFGDYACVVMSGNDSFQSPYIHIGFNHTAPTVDLLCDDVWKLPGETVTITCNTTGVPTPSIQWYRYHSTVPSKATGLSNPQLLIPDFQQEDSGVYYCEASNTEGTARSCPVLIQISSPLPPDPPGEPVITKHSPDSTLIYGTNLLLTCCSSGYPPPQYVWRKEGGSSEMLPDAVGIDSPNLLIPVTDAIKDGCNYTCIAVNSGGINTTEVTVLPAFEGPPFVGDLTPSPIVVAEGNEAFIYCNFLGHPPPNNTWTRLGGAFPQNAVVEESKGLHLSIMSASLNDSGVYVCNATNLHGSATAEFAVQVHPTPDPPFVPPGNVVVDGQTILQEGADLVLNCSAEGYPPITYLWIRSDTSLPAKVTNHDSAQLVIPTMAWSDVGLYYCLATNAAGTTQSHPAYVVLQAKNGTVLPSSIYASSQYIDMGLWGGVFAAIFVLAFLIWAITGIILFCSSGQENYIRALWKLMRAEKNNKNVFEFVVKVEPLSPSRLYDSTTSLNSNILDQMRVVRKVERAFEKDKSKYRVPLTRGYAWATSLNQQDSEMEGDRIQDQDILSTENAFAASLNQPDGDEMDTSEDVGAQFQLLEVDNFKHSRMYGSDMETDDDRENVVYQTYSESESNSGSRSNSESSL